MTAIPQVRLLLAVATGLALSTFSACSGDDPSPFPAPTPDTSDAADTDGDDVDVGDQDSDTPDAGDSDTNVDTSDVPLDVECDDGFVFDAEAGACVDVDECADGFTCDAPLVCLNTEGSVACVCPEGSEPDGDDCVDIDECAGESPCGENATCFNQTFSFECVCDIGFTGDGQTCEAECDLECGENEVCVAGTDSELCACATGFMPENDACVPIDLCERTAQVDIEILDVGIVDCVTPSVCLATVPNNSGDILFNALTQSYVDIDVNCDEGELGDSPAGTLWTLGFCGDLDDTPNEEFVTWAELTACRIGRLRDEDVCMLSVADDLRVSFQFQATRTFPGDVNAVSYARTSVGGCADSATCVSDFPRAQCTCPEGVPMLADGSCDLAAQCGLDCGDFGTCLFGEAGRFCECDAGHHWDGDTCVPTPACAGTMTYVHQPGAEGDCWNDDVCLTRASTQQIYNALLEITADGCSGDSPAGVLWARGTCEESDADTEFESLTDATGCNLRTEATAQPLCAELATGERVDVEFTEWVTGSGGGGGYVFAYERDAANRCFAPESCDIEADTCACPEGFEGDGIDCAYVGACDLACGANGECVRGAFGPECACDLGFRDLGDGCVDVDICEGDDPVVFVFSEETGYEPDCVRDDVCFARNEGGGGPIFNTATEEFGEWSNNDPNSRWGIGRCADNPEFGVLRNIRDQGFQPFTSIVGQPLCLRLLNPVVEYDLTFLSIDSQGDADFSYVRQQAERPCGPNSTCEDTDAAPICGCDPGFEVDASGACVDIDECAGDPCEGGPCVNSAGTFLCQCQTVEFEKVNYSEGVEDCISDDVCIARGDFRSIYNSAQSEEFDGPCESSQEPLGTLWARGTCAEDRVRSRFHAGSYAGCSPPDIVRAASCLELPDSGRLFDIEWTNWQIGGDPDPTDPTGERDGGGGFAYVRTEMSVGAACPAP